MPLHDRKVDKVTRQSKNMHISRGTSFFKIACITFCVISSTFYAIELGTEVTVWIATVKS